jgi:hypothetical protein
MHEPVVLIEILSPTDLSRTRANVRGYRTIPTVAEIVVLHSTAVVAKVLRRRPMALRLESIGYATSLRSAYRTAVLQ